VIWSAALFRRFGFWYFWSAAIFRRFGFGIFGLTPHA
jgi:hypothetical protein